MSVRYRVTLWIGLGVLFACSFAIGAAVVERSLPAWPLAMGALAIWFVWLNVAVDSARQHVTRLERIVDAHCKERARLIRRFDDLRKTRRDFLDGSANWVMRQKAIAKLYADLADEWVELNYRDPDEQRDRAVDMMRRLAERAAAAESPNLQECLRRDS